MLPDSHRTRRGTRATVPMWSAEADCTGKPDSHPCVEASPPPCAYEVAALHMTKKQKEDHP
jgi:hypothetical protein